MLLANVTSQQVTTLRWTLTRTLPKECLRARRGHRREGSAAIGTDDQDNEVGCGPHHTNERSRSINEHTGSEHTDKMAANSKEWRTR